MLLEFKKFVARGNVLDLAVGVIIGAAFGKITSSLVSDIIMPPIGMLLAKVDFENLYLNLSSTPYKSLAEAKAAGAPTINYGIFIDNIIEFFIISMAVFLVVRFVNRFNKRPVSPPEKKDCPFCLTEIPYKAKKCAHCTSNLPESA